MVVKNGEDCLGKFEEAPRTGKFRDFKELESIRVARLAFERASYQAPALFSARKWHVRGRSPAAHTKCVGSKAGDAGWLQAQEMCGITS
jgi:hypothetical protein